ELLQRPTLDARRSTSNSEEPNRTSNIKHQTSLSWWLAFYLSLALGFLAKGPIAWLPLLTVGVTIILARVWQSAWHFKFLGGTLLMLAVVALLGIPALVHTLGEFFALVIARHLV